MLKPRAKTLAICALAIAIAGCGEEETGVGEAMIPQVEFPASLLPMGQGYPADGDPCRLLGESEAVANWLDDSARLVGCPTKADAERLAATTVGIVDGFTIVSVPTGDANAGRPVETPVTDPDALVPGTKYHATAQAPCGFSGAEPTRNCPVGVIRNWGEDGTILVEVEKPDGRKRAIFFRGITPYGADSAQADGSAGWDFAVSRRDDQSIISYGPETYIIADAFVVGG